MNLSPLKESGITVIPYARLGEYTTFGLGGKCPALILCLNAAQVTLAVSFLRASNIPFVLTGFGSNILAADDGVDTVVVRYSNDAPLISVIDGLLNVDAATPFDALAEHAVNSGLEGMTSFSGIPGTVGGAIAGNAGAYGAQISDSLVDVTLIGKDNSIRVVSVRNILFSYRDSDLKHSGDIIISARFRLSSGDPTLMKAKRAEILATRTSKHGNWKDNPCAGSFFRNVEPTSKAGPRRSAGWFIEQAGGKDLRINGAHCYPKHANIITHEPPATAQDVYNLTLEIQKKVREKFDIALIREVRLLGKFRNGEGDPRGFW